MLYGRYYYHPAVLPLFSPPRHSGPSLALVWLIFIFFCGNLVHTDMIYDPVMSPWKVGMRKTHCLLYRYILSSMLVSVLDALEWNKEWLQIISRERERERVVPVSHSVHRIWCPCLCACLGALIVDECECSLHYKSMHHTHGCSTCINKSNKNILSTSCYLYLS